MKAAILQVLGREELRRLCDAFSLTGGDRRSPRSMAAVLQASVVPCHDVLDHLREPEVKRICESLGVPSTGRRRQLIQRLLEMENGSVPRQPSPREERRPEVFVAIDFETADYGPDSACAVALVRVENGVVVDRQTRLIRPPRRSFEFTYIHGITWRQVQGEGTFAEVWPALRPMLDGAQFMAAHNASFDRRVLTACCDAAGQPLPALPFECTVRLARQAWGLRPTRLPDVCSYLKIPLKHHDAASDAEACARIVVEARRTLPRVA